MAEFCSTFNHHSQASCRPIMPGFKPLLESHPDDELFDLIVAGFGPAGLAIAVALYDALKASHLPDLGRAPKVLFLEKQKGFAWHSGMLLPGAKMQISFVKDMASLRNPLSKFTFLNYLHHHDRTVEFASLNTFLPSRREFEDYLGWCAGHFRDVVAYSEEVTSVIPSAEFATPSGHLKVQSRHSETGHIILRQAKHVVVAIGGYPDIPQPFLSNPHQRFIHSSKYNHTVQKILPDLDAEYSIAVVGGGQSAAEIFHDLHNRYPRSKTSLLLRGSALRPSDDSPFVNEVFNPERIASFFDSPEDVR